jgi:DNA-binding NarL/FixJ family response regulator
MRLLLATAQPDLRLSLELLLSEQPGVEIVGAASESDGLVALTRTTNPDLVVTEWDLPGRAMANTITELHHFRHPPVVLLLIGDIGSNEEIIESGADAVIAKGSPPDHLLTVIKQLQRQIKSSKEINKYE